ncbi:two-component sensor histidine kinase [Plantibacter sp. VKM Ac-2880]|uniref:sensor histidine kinase n=1 Tax=Plantibacter sp. VKM Ac-2880 TaxID=2783827 RepID=UPI0018901F6F|nr:histidine kinase [Plantibacter sp. VKM Ac-2880]MBF4567686.1 two-component sensor histidine kinase [Plantibacter sp. VKM Ac-2880]
MTRRSRLWSVLVELAIIAAAVVESLTTLEWATPWESGLAIAAAVGLIFRRRWPWIALLFAVPAFTLNLATLAGLASLFSVAVRERRRWRLVATGVVVFVLAAVPWWGWNSANYTILAIVYAGLYAAAPIALGLLVRTRRELFDRIRDLEQVRRTERARIASDVLVEERTRIAREMHDVVSHQVSLIAVQAGAIQVQTEEPGTKRMAVTIRSLASRTLDELRDMVTLLRAETGHAPLAPQPTVEDLSRLIADSGIDVTAGIELPDGLPAPLQRAIYRTVQEGLTNARKHAPGAPVELRASASPDEVTVVIRNARPARSATTTWSSAGHGLVGLTERAELLNGTLLTEDAPTSFTLTFRAPY